MTWINHFQAQSTAAAEPHLVSQWAARLEARGYNDNSRLFAFAYDDLAEDLTKHRILLAYQMGLGKTGAAIVSADVRGSKHTLFVVPNKLVGEWEGEFRRLGLENDYQIITSLAQIDGYECPKCGEAVPGFRKTLDQDGKLLDVQRRCVTCDVPARHVDRLARFNIVSLRTLWTIPKDSPHAGREKKPGKVNAAGTVIEKERNRLKHSFAWYLRRRCENVVIDEAYELANPSALQTKAVFLLRPRRRTLLTGTPVRGFPDNILALLNWCLGSGTDLFPEFDINQEAAVRRFIEAFGTKIQKKRDDGSIYSKYLPVISNPERFQAMLAPVMRRRVNTEPVVAAAIKMPRYEIYPEQIELDSMSRSAYEKAVANFVAWYMEAKRQAEETDTAIPHMTTLTKLAYLATLAAAPQACVPGYTGYSSKQARIMEIVKSAIERGRKVILFSEFVPSAEFYAKMPAFADYKPTLITGSVSLSRSKVTGVSARDKRLNEFRDGDSQLLVATTTCFAEGLNVPQAGTVIFDSFPWTPSVQQQAWSRVLRPAQKHDPVEIHLVGMLGTIDDYLSAINALKRAAVGEGIDYETIEIDLDDIPDPLVYAHSLVESSTAVGKIFGATAWIERLKAKATAAEMAYAAAQVQTRP